MSQQLSLHPGGAGGADASLYSGEYANVNFGSLPKVTIGSLTIVKNTTHSRYTVRFDLSAIPPRSVILSATLSLTKDSGSYASDAIFRAYRLTRSDWTELGATWNQYDGANAWSAPGGDFEAGSLCETTLQTTDTQLVFPNLAPLVVDALALRASQLQLLVTGRELATSEYVNIHAADDPVLAARPLLQIDYVAPPVLALTDHGDGSGATVPITGAESGASTALYVRRFSGDPGGEDWITAGIFSSEGELPLALAPGHYFAQAVSLAGTVQVVSSVQYFVVTDGLESIHTRCLAAVQARIRLLALEGVADERVLVEKVPAGRNLAAGAGLPAIIVSPQRTAMPHDAGTNGTDDVHYDVQVSIFDRDNQEPTLAANLDRHLLWRQQIARAFRNQRLPGVPEVINSAVEPAEGPNESAWKHELMTTALRLRFTSREPRGF